MICRLVNGCRARTTGAFRMWFGGGAIQWQTGQKTRNFLGGLLYNDLRNIDVHLFQSGHFTPILVV